MTACANFRYNIRQICKPPGPSQRVIADRAGISSVHLNRILQGKAIPTLECAEKIAAAVDRPLTELLLHPEKIPIETA